MDAGTDLGFLFAATDEASLVKGLAATLAEVKDSHIAKRAAYLAGEIAIQMPDLIALQEVTLWRTGPLLAPPATHVLFDQLDLLLAELAKRDLPYGIVATQTNVDAEAPVPTAGLDLRMTDRDVILARIDLPQSQFDLVNAQTNRYRSKFVFGSALLGQIVVPCGWMTVDANIRGTKFRFVNTHLQSPVSGVPDAGQVQIAQAKELIDALDGSNLPVILAGDFNANAEPGPDHTVVTEKLSAAGFADVWRLANPADPGYTWPLFGEDQQPASVSPFERIDLIYTRDPRSSGPASTFQIIRADRTGAEQPWASDHAGVMVTLRLEN